MTDKIYLSVVIPVYNDPDGLKDTLDSLIDQKNPPQYEVIVVDNNSTDKTPRVIEEFEREYPDIVYGSEEIDIQSSYAARNTGIENSSGEILTFIDADVTVKNNWVASIVECFEEIDIDYLGCNVEMYIPEGDTSVLAQYDVSMGLPVKHYLETKQFVPTCALAIRHEVVDQVGVFDESLTSGGDKEFGKRVHKAGFKMGYSDQLIVRHPVRSTFREHTAKAKRIGLGQYQLWQRFDLAPHPLSPLRFVPPNPVRVAKRSKNSLNILYVYVIEYLLKLIQSSVGIYSLAKDLR
jgi:glycosyltransferase involved in cell wall biosynthesis